ncbi:hypothetical protein Ahy_B01g051649 [Arachis hypogaea]|uniref:Peroxidase n=1 Tax=Arachis hypogaea TaxID=3818 RepID=A0A445AMG0_ARAHY|nr:hypothetical protein Ahy_B01g051649 [Arachis hypogaea]
MSNSQIIIQYYFLVIVVMVTTNLGTWVIPTNGMNNDGNGRLTHHFYKKTCPKVLPVIRSVVEKAIKKEPRIGASLLRLHFHDCFVNGCDASVLLDDSYNINGEKNSPPNKNSLRGFEVVDEIKSELDKACKGPILGGPHFGYHVLLGRRDARSASNEAANTSLPSPSSSFSELLSNFKSHGLGLKDLVALSGAHTIGFAQCSSFRDRIYNDTNIDPKLASYLKLQKCPQSGGDSNLAPFDSTNKIFDNVYYKQLLDNKGLLHSDQELFKGNNSESDRLVKLFTRNPVAFAKRFGHSMIKMGNMKPLTGNEGEIRINCRKVN